jgi:hypothetical protein
MSKQVNNTDSSARNSLRAAIIAHDSAARAAQKASDALSAARRMVARAEATIVTANKDLEAAKANQVDALTMALTEGADDGPHETKEIARARMLAADGELQLDAARSAFERLETESAKAEGAFQKAQKARDSAIKRIISIEDVEALIAKANSLEQALEGVHSALRYIRWNLAADDSETRRRLIDYLFAVVFKRENVPDEDPSVAPWVRFKEQLHTNPDATLPS